MSEFHIRVVQLGPITKHPNADTLSITHVGGDGGYPVILRTGEYQEGARAVYVPVGAAVPASDPRWAFLVKPGSTKPYVEIDAKRLRGVFSMGLLTAADPAWEVGRDVREALGIVRAEDVETGRPASGGDNEGVPDPGLLPCYTDIEGLRAHGGVLQAGEEVVITEKIHGQNARLALDASGHLHIGTRARWVRADGATTWAKTAARMGMTERLARVPGIGVFGECYGNVAGMRYDAPQGGDVFRLFDAMHINSRTYLDYDAFVEVAQTLGIHTAPVLYRGPWHDGLRALADGASTINPQHVREGIVIRPVRERVAHMGRVILKLHGERYLLKQWKV